MIPTSRPSNSLVVLVSTSLMLALVGLAATACQAPQEVRQGGEGEYCNGDDEECRADLVCQDFICTSPDNGQQQQETDECDQICERLDDCDAPLDNCVGRCENTVSDWGQTAIEHFANCFTDDRSCEQLRDDDDPPQTCYDRIPVDDRRESRCEDFESAVFECEADDEAIDELRSECRAAARVAGPDRWDDVESCNDRIDEGCQETFDCLNVALDLSPGLE